jgi:hypothetical protein
MNIGKGSYGRGKKAEWKSAWPLAMMSRWMSDERLMGVLLESMRVEIEWEHRRDLVYAGHQIKAMNGSHTPKTDLGWFLSSIR